MKSDRAAIVLQARMGSTRLPGKALALIDGRTIARALRRAAALALGPAGDPGDDHAARGRRAGDEARGSACRWCAVRPTTCWRAIALAADDVRPDRRSCARRPTTRPSTWTRRGARSSCSHAPARTTSSSTGCPMARPSRRCRRRRCTARDALATDPYDREHVTSFLRRDRRFRALDALAPGDVRRPDLRLTVDTPGGSRVRARRLSRARRRAADGRRR